MNHDINRLIHFARENHLLKEADEDYAINLLLDLLQESNFEKEIIHESLEECTPILDSILVKAVKKGLVEDSITAKDLFDTKIMNCLMPRPSEVIQSFYDKQKENPKLATDYYYHLSIASNYIRKSRTDKNIKWQQFVKYGKIQISINLSKPEKDPKEIAKAKSVKSSNYPKCLLCKENVGFAGNFNHPARQTHRIIPLSLEGEDYYLQYSPYVYYNEHCIVLNKEHIPMVINEQTIRKLFAFLDQFPHYMIGSNADLPIVGGSILSHDHFQGGRHVFPIEEATILKTFAFSNYPKTKVEMIKWPLSTIRLTGSKKEEIIKLASKILKKWKKYDNPALDIISKTGDTIHQTITPIARMKDGCYQLDVVLRNNRTNETYPDGIFHPHPESHHIKKENIGLIEVMGLAILPARLKDEIGLLKACLLNQKQIKDYPELKKHEPWFHQLKNENKIEKETIDDLMKLEITKKFVSVLEDAGVFKMNETGINAFIKFVESIDKEEKND